MHLIIFQILPMLVMLLILALLVLYVQRAVQDSRAFGACMILLLVVVLQSHLDFQLKQSGKRLARHS